MDVPPALTSGRRGIGDSFGTEWRRGGRGSRRQTCTNSRRSPTSRDHAGDDAARHVLPQRHRGHWGLQSRDDTVMPRPAPSNHRGAVAFICEENDVSTPKVPDPNKAAAAMRPVEASTACFVPKYAPAAAPTTAATMNIPPTQ